MKTKSSGGFAKKLVCSDEALLSIDRRSQLAYSLLQETHSLPLGPDPQHIEQCVLRSIEYRRNLAHFVSIAAAAEESRIQE